MNTKVALATTLAVTSAIGAAQTIEMNGTTATLGSSFVTPCSTQRQSQIANVPQVRSILSNAQSSLGGTSAIKPSSSAFTIDTTTQIRRAGGGSSFTTKLEFVPLEIRGMRGFPSASGILLYVKPNDSESFAYPRLLVRSKPGELLTSEYAIDITDGKFKPMAAKHGDCLLRSSQRITKKFWGAAETWSNQVLQSHSSRNSPLIQALREVYGTQNTSNMLTLPTSLMAHYNLEHAFNAPTLERILASEFKVKPQDNKWVKEAKAMAKQVIEELIKKLKEKLAKVLASWVMGG